MKFLAVVIFFGLTNFYCNSQSISKVYYGNDTLEFIEFLDQRKINFFIHSDGCLGGLYHSGEGIYQLRKNTLIVKVQSHDKSLESTYQIIKDSAINYGYIIKGYIFDENGYLMPGVTLTYKIGKKVYGVSTDKDGNFYKEISSPIISDISITFIGYRQCIIPPNPLKLTEYKILMKEPFYNFPDNQILKAKIYFDDDSHNFRITRLKIK